jgi:Phosphotransferase enzyme family
VHDGLTYFIEESLGAETLGDRFEAALDAGKGITDDGFADFLDVIGRQTHAQLTLRRRPASGREFERLIGVHKTAKRLPDLAERIVDAFHIAVMRLGGFPSTLVHSDLHAFNMCAGGVIDLEGAGWGIAGYDVLTAAYVSDLCDLANRRWFTTQQLEAHVALVDGAFASHGLTLPSNQIDEFLLCRTIALCSSEHPRLEIRRCRDHALRTMLARFEAGRALLPPADG